MRILASHPDYEAINELATMLAVAANPHLHGGEDMPQAEIAAIIASLCDEMQDIIDGAPAVFIRGLAEARNRRSHER